MKVDIRRVPLVVACIRWAFLLVGAVFLLVFDWVGAALVCLVLGVGFGIALRFERFKFWFVAKLTGIPADALRGAYVQGKAQAQSPSPVAPPAPPVETGPWGGQTPTRQVQSKEKIAAFMARERQEAILLKRHWPPHEPSDANSWLGGTPRLPEGVDWPQNPETGLALHHMAQIDLAEMPALTGGPFPEEGMLWFFADIDEEMCWREGPENGQTRVIYHPVSTRDCPLQEVPENLPELDHSGGQMTSALWGHRGPTARGYVRWPVTGHISGAWAFSDQLPEGVTDWQGYATALDAAWAQEREAVLGPKQSDGPGALPVLEEREEERKAKNGAPYKHQSAVYVPNGAGGHFPYTVRLAQLVMDRLMHKVEANLPRYQKMLERKDGAGGMFPDAQQSIAEGLTRAVQMGAPLREALAGLDPDDAFPAALQADFDALMSALAGRELGSLYFKDVVRSACIRLVAEGMGRPEILKDIPSGIVDGTLEVTSPAHVYTNHYLGGPKGSASNPTAGHGIRLAQFDSDGAMGMMFCDVGIVDFWISEEDLTAGRWERAWGATAGG